VASVTEEPIPFGFSIDCQSLAQPAGAFNLGDAAVQDHHL
jgi:hypothetical protein